MTEDSLPIEWLADSSLLICFGALPDGGTHLLNAYGRTVGVTPTVRYELNRIARADVGKPRGVAASAFSGRHASKLLDASFQRRDEAERRSARDRIAKNQRPATPLPAVDQSPEGKRPGRSPWTGTQHAGEAETIAVACRSRVGVLMTDRAGRNYAEGRNIEVHSFTKGFSRLIGKIKPHEMYRLWLKVDGAHLTGPEVIRGQNDFRPPPPRSR